MFWWGVVRPVCIGEVEKGEHCYESNSNAHGEGLHLLCMKFDEIGLSFDAKVSWCLYRRCLFGFFFFFLLSSRLVFFFSPVVPASG